MARSVIHSLTRTTTIPRFLPLRHRSSGPDHDADPSDRAALRNLEDAVHRIIVQRSQPYWIPFRPGSSYWVPPKTKSRGFANVIRKLANTASPKNTALAIYSVRGWPSEHFYYKGAAPAKTEVESSSKKLTQSKDEES